MIGLYAGCLLDNVRIPDPENISGDINRRRGLIVNSEQRGNTRIVEAEVPLSEMFGYTTELRSMSQGRASSVMEPLKYAPAPASVKTGCGVGRRLPRPTGGFCGFLMS